MYKPVPLSATELTLKSSEIVQFPPTFVVPSKLTQAFAVLFATLSDSVPLVESIGKVMEPAAGVVLMADVDTVVTRPLASMVSVTASVLVP